MLDQYKHIEGAIFLPLIVTGRGSRKYQKNVPPEEKMRFLDVVILYLVARQCQTNREIYKALQSIRQTITYQHITERIEYLRQKQLLNSKKLKPTPTAQQFHSMTALGYQKLSDIENAISRKTKLNLLAGKLNLSPWVV